MHGIILVKTILQKQEVQVQTTGLHPSRGDYVSILYYEQHRQRDVSLHDDLNYIDHYTSLFKGH